MDISAFSHRGVVRSTNEDSCLALPPWQEPALTTRCCVFAVADGMGGHSAGEVASQLAVSKIRACCKQSERILPLNDHVVNEIFAEANFAIWQSAQNNPDQAGMGTTLTILLVNGRNALIGHVGDTRLYLIRDGCLRQLTNDHTLVGEQVRQGKLTPEAARVHPTRNILSRVLGAREFIMVDIQPIELVEGDTVFICSDGIYGQLTDDQILKIITESGIRRASLNLITAANNAGGMDNATSVIIRFNQFPVPVIGRFSWQRLVSAWRTMGAVCSS